MIIRKSLSLAFFFAVTLVQLQAQFINEKGWYDMEALGNVEVGWIKKLEYNQPAKPTIMNGWNYPAKQIDNAQKLVTWLQQSYTPVGMLGEMKLSILAPQPSLDITNKYYDNNEAEKNNRNALPNTYGAFARIYMFLMKTSTKKYWPIDGLADYFSWHIMINNVESISKQLVALSSTDEYYCIQPKYSIGMKGEFDRDWYKDQAVYRNFDKSPNLQKYQHYLIPAKIVDAGGAKYVVILTKDNQPLPFEQVTVGQLIKRFEDHFPMMYKIAMNNNTKVDNLLENGKRGIQLLKEKYKNQLNDYVYFRTPNQQISALDLAGIEPGKNVYWLQTEAITSTAQGHVYDNFPLLRLKKGVKELCAKGEPQWIVCRLDQGGHAGYEAQIHMTETFIERINYDYIYNCFFGKDKVIQPYKPLSFVDPEANNNSQAIASPSTEASKKATDKSILFFDDFSTTAIGFAPGNWSTQRSEISGDKVAVVEVNGAKGKWLKLKRNAAPKNLQFPIAGDFELSFDLLVQKGDVPWGTPGIESQLTFSTGQGDKQVNVSVSPGDMNRENAAGWIIITPLAGCNISSYYSIADFTGSKPVNKVTITIRKTGTTIAILSNNNKVYDCGNAFTNAWTLKKLNFYVNEKNVFHLSNVQMRKL